jgi:hypothetical protein
MASNYAIKAARIITEVAPPQFTSIMRRRKVRSVLDTIKEEEKDAKLESQGKSFFNCPSAAVVFRRDLN